MLTDFEGTEIEIIEATRLIRGYKDKFEESNVNFLKLKFHKSMGWANRLLGELEARCIVGNINAEGLRKVL